MSIWVCKKMPILSYFVVFILIMNGLWVTLDLPEPRQAAHAALQMIAFWDSGSGGVPTGWTSISTYATDAFYDRYIYAGDTYSATGGAPAHAHSMTYFSETNSPPLANFDNSTGSTASPGAHSHGSLAGESITAADNLPAYNNLIVMSYDDGVPTTLASGIILMFTTSDTSTNWQLYSAQNTKFLRGAASTAASGNSTPTHTVASGLGPSANSQVIGGTGVETASLVNHQHAAGVGTATNAPSIEPPYMEVVFQQTTASTALRDGMIAGFNSPVVGASWMLLSGGGGDYYQKFIKGDNAGALVAGGAATHSHTTVTPTTGLSTSTATRDGLPNDQSTATNLHTHTVTITLEANVDHTPEYAELVLAEYNPSYTPQMNNWRWYADEEDEAVDTYYANENTAAPQAEMGQNTRVKLRINLTETGGAGENDSRKVLRYSTDQSNWVDVGAIGSSTAVFRYYNGGGADNDTLSLGSTVLSDSDPTSRGIHNESDSAGPSKSDHPASTIVEFEYCIEGRAMVAADRYYFSLYDEVLAAAIPLGDGKSYPYFQALAAFALSVSGPGDVDLGSWALGAGGKHTYNFVGGEEITSRDDRGLNGATSYGWTLAVEVTTPLVSGANTIPAADTYWITNTITGLFAAPTTSMSGNAGEHMSAAVTAITAMASGYSGMGGYTILPTIEIHSAPATGSYAGVITFTIS